MESYLCFDRYDLITPDGAITQIDRSPEGPVYAVVSIKNISPAFMGFKIDLQDVFFNIKSSLAQLGVNGIGREYALNPSTSSAEIKVELIHIGKLGKRVIDLLEVGAYIGKLFAADPRRRVRDLDYLFRMFGRSDRDGHPLLALGGLQGSKDLILEKIDGHTVAYLSIQDGKLIYDDAIEGFLPTFCKMLHHPRLKSRGLLQLNQKWVPNGERRVKEGELLLVRTLPLHIRTVFGRVVDSLLPHGFHHTTASILQPDTKASGDVYELFGSSEHELSDIPLEFYTLEPHREYVFFEDRDQLQSCLENSEALFKAFETAPKPENHRCAVFVVKGEQMLNLSPKDWISRDVHMNEFPGLIHPGRQAMMVQHYIQQQPSYPFLKAIETGLITSQGVLFVRHFPSPLMKKMLLEDSVQRNLKGIYFQYPSQSYGDFFSHEDRSMLLDLAKFAIPVFWVDKTSGKVLQYVPKPEKDSGMFVPLPDVDTFLKATSFGIYGSNLSEGNFEAELTALLQGIKEMRTSMNHPLLNKDIPLALITGGGPGVMELGNRVAKNLDILSCANIADFRQRTGAVVNEQRQNPYIDAKMTYRIDRLVERQAEFNLDFPIILYGGFGTDFEFALEEVRRKTGSTIPTPVLLFGDPNYWKQKITPRFQANLAIGTISGSEWVSNCFYCIQTAAQGLKIYRQFFENTLPIGKHGPIHKEGFVIV